MMLHRHFEERVADAPAKTKPNVTEERREFVSNIFPPDSEPEKPAEPKRRRTRKKADN